MEQKSIQNQDISSSYNPQNIEAEMYKLWEKYFNPDNLPARHKKPFTIIMPPPNANGSLHLGHALFVTLEDIMIRYQRMCGKKSLWLPGADHAGFETQVVYNKKLEKEGRAFWDIPRDQLYQEIKEFTLANKAHMEGQLKKLGASCDWSREKFTLDDDIIQVVYSTFEKLYQDGLIYRAEKPVNWCTKHQTTLSDLETRYEERGEPFYYFKYGPFVIGTSRPETKFGDKYVVMHPDDKRYAQYKHGEKITLEWINGPITATVIKDKAIDMNFGTGVMTITPWHDQIDFDIAQRQNLEKEQIIDKFGRLLPIAGEFAGMKIAAARPLIVEKLKNKGLLEKIDEHYKHNVQLCYKCGTVVEPQIMSQWFIKMTEAPKGKNKKSLRDLAIEAVRSKEVVFIPKRMEKIFMHWMKELRDWNISRQIVWGIRMPIWYCQEQSNEKCRTAQGIIVSKKIPEKCPLCSSTKLEQEADVFDTWFSSGQWPFATLQTTQPKDFKTFYPTDVMETGWDILFFWVARMVMLGKYATGKAPFHTVYLHGLVRDKERQKMSKSKGNVINPLEVAETYGTDAVRMALIVGTTAGNDPVMSEDKIRGYRNFATKVWNASRFVLINYKPSSAKPKFTTKDKKNLKDLKDVAKKITKNLDAYDFNHAAETIYHYFWHTFADKVIEESKQRLNSENESDRAAAQEVLMEILGTTMKLLHPFMPFLTEAVWQKLPLKKDIPLIIESWPHSSSPRKK